MKPIAVGYDPFGKGQQFIAFRAGADFVTIRIDTRQSEPEFQDTVDRINEIINKATRERNQ